AINANRGENKREQSQTAEQNRAHPRGPESKSEMLSHRLFVGDGNVIIDVPDDAMNFGHHRSGGAGGVDENCDPAIGKSRNRVYNIGTGVSPSVTALTSRATPMTSKEPSRL